MRYDGMTSGYPTPTSFHRLTGYHQNPRDRGVRVTVNRKEVVAATVAVEVQRWLPLSNLDLILPPVDVSVFFCYKKSNSDDHDLNSFGSKARVLKKPMAQELVCYYAFSGELVGEGQLLCNNRGMDFIEAYADAKLQDLCFYNPDDTIEGKLIPKKHHGVLSVQVKCMYLLLSLANMIFILNQNLISSSF